MGGWGGRRVQWACKYKHCWYLQNYYFVNCHTLWLLSSCILIVRVLSVVLKMFLLIFATILTKNNCSQISGFFVIWPLTPLKIADISKILIKFYFLYLLNEADANLKSYQVFVKKIKKTNFLEEVQQLPTLPKYLSQMQNGI